MANFLYLLLELNAVGARLAQASFLNRYIYTVVTF